MLEQLHDFLASSPILRLFGVIGLGYVLGRIRLGGGSLGVAAVLFVGLALGAWDAAAFEVPALLGTVGLTLFVYTIGLSSGPAVVRSLRSRSGLRLTGLTLGAVTLAALTTLAMARLLALPPAQAAGLFSGAITNTPALAAQLEWLQHRAAEGEKVDAQGPTVGYSLSYPFGVLGTLLLMMAVPGAGAEAAPSETVESRNYRVTHLKPNGNQLEAEWVRQQTGLVVARRLHSGQLDVVEGESVLALDDVVLAVGTPSMHARALEVLGEPAPQHLEQHPQLVYRRFFVSNRAIIGKPLNQVYLQALHATLTRVRRGDVEMPASPDLVLLQGDVVRVVAHPDQLPRLAEYFGDSLDDIADTDFLSISLGMVLGVMVGALPLPSGGSLGVAGGTLLVALFLGARGRTGSILWTLPREANLALRHFGLLLFLASVGLRAGGEFRAALGGSGGKLLLAGALVTLSSALPLLAVLRYGMGQSLAATLGTVAGAHTQPACLALAESRVKPGPTAEVGVHYAAVFPVAMIGKIVWGTLLLTLLGA